MGTTLGESFEERPRQPRMARRRKRTISSMSRTEVLDEMERFSRRTLSVCMPQGSGPSDFSEDDEIQRQDNESMERDSILCISYEFREIASLALL